MTEEPRCKNCPFVHKTNAAIYCRRFPPQGHPLWVHRQQPKLMAPGVAPQKPELTVETVFPFTDPDWWCGEHPLIRALYENPPRVVLREKT